MLGFNIVKFKQFCDSGIPPNLSLSVFQALESPQTSPVCRL